MERVVISLGSNIGNRFQNLRKAVDSLSSLGENIEVSSVYETPPWGNQNQACFLNSVMSFETTLSPEGLLSRIQSVESNLGRKRIEKWGPRIIDLDIILFGSQTLESEELKVPHPHCTERAFVLIPLSDLNLGKSLFEAFFKQALSTMLDAVESKGINKIDKELL
jgi:2-amino-4-hydroxy-6-hydroxymethyldihydropteridine diphosphokinase